jgi:hypothetical protein
LEQLTVNKVKGELINIPCDAWRWNWDTVVITGDALEPPDWSEFESREYAYALELRNQQTEIPKSVFESDENLTRISAPSVRDIGDTAFRGCICLESASFPQVRCIGEQAFNDCENLRDVSLDKVEKIGDSAFQNCVSLRFVDLSALQSIGEYAFAGCERIACALLPEACRIGGNAFHGCKELRYVFIPKADKMERNTFSRCENLTYVSIPGVKVLESGAFFQCGALRVFELGEEPPLVNGDKLFTDFCARGPMLLVVPDKTKYTPSVMEFFPAGSEPVVFSPLPRKRAIRRRIALDESRDGGHGES